MDSADTHQYPTPDDEKAPEEASKSIDWRTPAPLPGTEVLSGPEIPPPATPHVYSGGIDPNFKPDGADAGARSAPEAAPSAAGDDALRPDPDAAKVVLDAQLDAQLGGLQLSPKPQATAAEPDTSIDPTAAAPPPPVDPPPAPPVDEAPPPAPVSSGI
ncbi:MAG TPA: hypothetical protein VNT22_08500, partial [Baekduia sp.]|nr:hypothetical protein [Baekduia sp.]